MDNYIYVHVKINMANVQRSDIRHTNWKQSSNEIEVGGRCEERFQDGGTMHMG
jgi:hypothetical protein